MEIEIEGIVLRQVVYKEKDAMMTILTPNGIASFFARGILSLTSKNAASCLVYAHSRFILSSSGERLSLRKGQLINSFYKNYESVLKMSALGLMSEVIFKISNDDDGRLYSPFLKILNLLSNDFDVITLITIYLAKAILFSGYSLTYDKCYLCRSKRSIVAVDYLNGGFVCKKCAVNLTPRSAIYLKTFRYVFMVEEDNYAKVTLNKTVCLNLITDFLNYLKNKFAFYKWNAQEMFFNALK